MDNEIKFIDTPTSLLSLITEYDFDPRLKKELSRGEIREELRHNFDPDEVYYFFRTIANPKSISELSKTQVDIKHAQTIDKSFERDTTLFSDQNTTIKLEYNNSLLNLYMYTLKVLTEKSIETGAYHSVQFLEQKTHTDNWSFFSGHIPRIHIIKGSECADNFPNIIESLIDKETFEIIRYSDKRPWYTGILEANHLMMNNLPPILLYGEKVPIEGRTLKTFLDLLTPYTFKVSETNPHIDD